MESESQKDIVKLKARIRQFLICVEIRSEKRATPEGFVGGALGTQMGSSRWAPVLKVDAHGAHVRGTKESWGDQKAG